MDDFRTQLLQDRLEEIHKEVILDPDLLGPQGHGRKPGERQHPGNLSEKALQAVFNGQAIGKEGHFGLAVNGEQHVGDGRPLRRLSDLRGRTSDVCGA